MTADGSPVADLDCCILVSTCDRYRAMAELTGRQLDRHWPGHPPVFYCGATSGDGETWLPLRDRPADWMGIVGRAVSELRRRGFRLGYLILEDHPPVFACAVEHLNRTLPGLMMQLGAAYIGLNGWGQGKPQRGVILGREHYWLEHLSRSFLWKFQLHPALWRLDALTAILEGLAPNLPLERRSPWAFERGAGREDAPVPEDLKERAYRVCGERMSARPVKARLVGLERLGVVLLRSALGRLLGDGARRRVEEVAGFVFGYYDGPYPLFRSGALVKGRTNPALVRFLTLHGRRGLAHEFQVATGPVPAGECR